MKKLFFIGALLIALGAYALWNTFSNQTATSLAATSTTPPPQSPTPVQQQPPQPQPATPPINSNTGRYRDGTYTGSVTDAFYGPLQVRAVIQNGALVNIVFLQYPNDNPYSQERSAVALPQLKQEAIATQSAQVDLVSGATATSEAFVQSLTTALNKA